MLLKFLLSICLIAHVANAGFGRRDTSRPKAELSFARYCSKSREFHVFSPSEELFAGARVCLYNLRHARGIPIVLRNLTVTTFYSQNRTMYLKFAVPKQLRVHLSFYAWKIERLAAPATETGAEVENSNCSETTPFQTCFVEVGESPEQLLGMGSGQHHHLPSNQDLHCFLPPRQFSSLLNGCETIEREGEKRTFLAMTGANIILALTFFVIAVTVAVVVYMHWGRELLTERNGAPRNGENGDLLNTDPQDNETANPIPPQDPDPTY